MGNDAFLAVDPGIRECGVALFVGRTLERCTLVKSPAPVDAPAPLRCAAMAASVELWAANIPDVLVVEWPQVYRAGRGKRGADPNDLLLLSGVCSALAARGPWGVVGSVLPREWKGTLPKEVACERVLARLSQEERVIVDALRLPKSRVHHVLDAVGIGFHSIGRGLR